MTRKEYLEFCQVCTHRKLDFHKGIVCDLTDEHADFESNCKNYIEDPVQKEFVFHKKMSATGDHQSGDSIDFKKNIETGAITFWFSLGIFIFTLTFVGSIVIVLPFGAILYGAAQYLRGKEQEKVWHEHKKNDDL